MQQCDGVLVGAKRWGALHRAIQRGAQREHIGGEVRLAPRATSGARYAGVPWIIPRVVSVASPKACAIPKSLIKAVPSSAIRMLRGFTSR